MDLMYTTIYNQYFMEKLYMGILMAQYGSHVFPQRLATKKSMIIFVWSTSHDQSTLREAFIELFNFNLDILRLGHETHLFSRGVESEGILIVVIVW